MLKAGIVGLPNVGKSTLFNALTRSHKAPAENYPFCTIEPNIGVVAIPDTRLEELARVAQAPSVVPAAIEYVDIAGLVKGASHGEGMGNKFLSHIREVDAIIQVVRCFEDPDIVHVSGAIDPVRDIEVVFTELALADLETVKRRREKLARDVKRGDKAAGAEEAVLQKLEPHLNAGKTAITLKLAPEERQLVRGCFLLTEKPTILAANVKEPDLAGAGENPLVKAVREYAAAHLACETVIISAQLESDLADLAPAEAAEYLASLGVEESGVRSLLQHTFHLLNLRTYFTFNEKELRAWILRAGETASRAAGQVHSDFERGFIKADTVSWKDLVACGTVGHAREKGHYRAEGRDYVVQDGDVLLFKYHI
jgi:GTP-binding protein YchF